MESDTIKTTLLNDPEMLSLSDLPSEDVWLENARTKSPETARYYKTDLLQFKEYFGIKKPEDYRKITAKHITQWKLALQYGPQYKIADKIPKDAPKLIGNGAVARKLSSVSALFTWYCTQGSMKANPFKVISRPSVDNQIGKSKIINEAEARKLLSAPLPYTIKGKRDRAILSTFLYHGLRRAELCDLKMNSMFVDNGVNVFLIKGKGDKIRRIPINPSTIKLINEYFNACDHPGQEEDPLFLPLKNYRDEDDNLKHITGDGIYKIIMHYALQAGIDINKFHPHSLRATAATNALNNNADIVEVRKWLGHSNIQTTRIYDHREQDDAKSPTFKISY